MQLFQRIFFAAVLAGTVAGLISSTIQQWRLVPLILEAEQYEGDHAHAKLAIGSDTINVDQDSVSHAHDVVADAIETNEPWAPQDGFERAAYTSLATILVSIGFAFALIAAAVIFEIELSLATGLMWGLAGYIVFSLAPAFGLVPELPGMPAAEVLPRQVWWWGTVGITGAALLAMVKMKTLPVVGVALTLISLPHIIGAPQAPHDPSDVPAHLASTFAASTLTAALIFWLAMGVTLGWANTYFAQRMSQNDRGSQNDQGSEDKR